jgi:hypothetical protein
MIVFVLIKLQDDRFNRQESLEPKVQRLIFGSLLRLCSMIMRLNIPNLTLEIVGLGRQKVP